MKEGGGEGVYREYRPLGKIYLWLNTINLMLVDAIKTCLGNKKEKEYIKGK